MTPPPKRRLRQLGISLAATIVAIGAAELGLRAVGFSFRLYPEEIEFGYPNTKKLPDHFVSHPEYIWESRAHRDKLARARQERPQIVFTGCSCTEWGRFDVELEAIVAASEPERELVTANFACTGWSSFQGLQHLRNEVIDLGPQIVTIYFGWNDHWIGFGVDDRTASKITSSRALNRLQDLRMVQLWNKMKVSRQASHQIDLTSRPLRVSLDDFRANLTEMVTLCQANGIVPVLITAPTSHVRGEEPQQLKERWIEDLSKLVPLHQQYVDVVRQVARDEGVVLCDLAAQFAELDRMKIKTLMRTDGIHLVPEVGGKFVARRLYKTLVENSLLRDAAGAGSGEERR